MNFWKNKPKRKIFIWTTSIILVIALIIGACAIYLCDYYTADLDAIEVFAPMSSVEYVILENDNILFAPENPVAGFIFYPGGKVEYTAYVPLMAALAEQDILCVLVEMPFNLAVFDSDAADGIQDAYPMVENWYIGGHSLGGAMAASYLEDNADEFEGLVLLGAYSTADLSGTDLEVLSVYGSEDKVLDMEKYSSNISNLPKDFTEIIINGGCHAYFGIYGAQEGDGTPTITNEEQILTTARYISHMIKERD